MSWLLCCIGFTGAIFVMICLPLWQHQTLPRAQKWLFSIGIFGWIVLGGLALYTLVGTPQMAFL